MSAGDRVHSRRLIVAISNTQVEVGAIQLFPTSNAVVDGQLDVSERLAGDPNPG